MPKNHSGDNNYNGRKFSLPIGGDVRHKIGSTYLCSVVTGEY